MSDPSLLVAFAMTQVPVSSPPAIPPKVISDPAPAAFAEQNESLPEEIAQVQPERNFATTEFSQPLRPSSGSQLYWQRLAALRSGRLYTRLPTDSFWQIWTKATGQQTYEQWRSLLASEARAVAKGQGNNQLSVLLGDSLSLWFPSDRLPTNHLWLNQGISGDTTRGILRRLNDFAQARPSTIYLMAGVNDLKHGYSDSEILGNFQQIFSQLRRQHPKAQIVVQSILPTRTSQISNTRVEELNQSLARLANNYRVNYLDVYSQMVDLDGSMQTNLTTDGIHLSALGYETWEWMLRQAETVIARAF
jgi:lysophospholipase L1-like esterase